MVVVDVMVFVVVVVMFVDFECDVGGCFGVCVIDMVSGWVIEYCVGECFLFCSMFKVMLSVVVFV